ncbi:sugar phosphate isomerase/epimerase [Niallia circulans]|uniref:sugar phosphate isomerase/epimerase family protein n=1 Tax=Niallia circulans TaxID=1397 RepID=UPI00201D7B7C|nr:sugar phosphate isomerase/epimerase family protein [Niallia circulans]UQZ74760.1 sugar phosphate isomerase/epimerase [Niallia circulans]
MKIDRIAPGNYHFKRYTIDYFLDSVSELGFKYIELWASGPHFHLDYFTLNDIKELKKKIDYRNLKVDCLTPEQAVYPISISHPDKQYRQNSIDFFKRHIEAATVLDCKKVLVTTGIAYLDIPINQQWEWCRESLEAISKAAENEGVTLVLEAFTKYSTHVFNTSSHIVKMIEEVGSHALKGLIDIDVVASTGEESIDSFIDTLGDNLHHVHFVDGNPGGHLVPGDGSLNMQHALEKIASTSYQGCLGLEFLDRRYFLEPEKALIKTIKWLEDNNNEAKQ